ncbi:MAG: hypothetical protein HWN66_08385 [Candidatus Helarchaeota archaeon]|nr:hypothetical protein [Candidatus Helarchaeota archaeon]
MGAAKTVGGILALTGGTLVLIWCLIVAGIMFAAPTPFIIGWIINLLLAMLGLVGGILGLVGKKAGGALALIAGLVWILLMVLLSMGVFGDPITNWETWAMLAPYSLFGAYVYAIPYITLEGLLCLIGGILILAGGED